MTRLLAVFLICTLVALGIAIGAWAFFWLRSVLGPALDITVPVSLGGLILSQLTCVLLGAFWRGQR